ncbi:hypothetical protein ANN_07541 [Periplaneta americana]|uniref:Endonuclease-reverse transcriptase n=1 Tax=Periplaneta americana TaxID=6978 RepID=A0ABQ8T0I3_PERAM|nr:hypothetical protein ANN_07541 [Periplaneta americana]
MSPVSITESYPAFARIGLRKNHGRNLNQVTSPDRDSNPGHLVLPSDSLTVAQQVWTKYQFEKLIMNLLKNTPSVPKYGIVRKKISGVCNKDIIINGQKYEEVDSFKYLGVLITQENTADTDMRQRIAGGNRCLRALNKTLRARCISKKAKLTLYKTVVRPIVLYGSETWTLSKKMEQQLMTWERKILRKIYGSKYENGHWRIRYNTELKTQYKSPDIVAEIKARRLEWLGHVIRMNDQRIPKKILNTKPEGRRNIGRQKLRWLDGVEDDLRTVGVRRWRQKALVGQEWTKILREAKARLQGP